MCDSVVDGSALLAFWSPGPSEMMVLAAVALLLYGGKLPEVARSWGKSFAEFRRGLSGIQSELNEAIYHEPQKLEYQPDPTSYSDNSNSDDSNSDDSLYDPANTSTEDSDENSDENSAADLPETAAAEEGQQEEAAPDDALSEGDSAASKRD